MARRGLIVVFILVLAVLPFSRARAATTWNPSDKNASITLSNGNLTATRASGGGHVAARGTTTHSTGKWYFETYLNVANGAGILFAGIASASFSLSQIVGGDAYSVGCEIGTYTNKYCYYNGNGSIIGTADGGSVGSWAAIAVDLDNHLIWERSSPAANWNNSGTANPATGTGGFTYSAITGALYPALSIYDSGSQTTANFGATSFAGSVPSGFAAWDDSADDPSSAPVRNMRLFEGFTIKFVSGRLVIY